MREISRSAIVDIEAARLYALVEDVAAYPAFLPWCLAAEVRERSADATLATLTVGIKAVRHSFTTRNSNDPPRAIHIRLVEGPFRHFEARWAFTPLGEGAARIAFHMAYEFRNAAIAAALGPLFQNIADTMVDAFTRRAQDLHGRAAG